MKSSKEISQFLDLIILRATTIVVFEKVYETNKDSEKTRWCLRIDDTNHCYTLSIESRSWNSNGLVDLIA